MNWKLKLVLLVAKLRPTIEIGKPIDVATLREKSEAAARLTTRLFDTPVSIFKTTDVKAGEIPLRIYQNSKLANQRVIIYYHGGGFVLYGIQSHDNVCRRLCKMNNCIVVSVDYRLAPEHTFPAAHNDAFAAIQWVRENISSCGGNPNFLLVAGDSAGGNLSACMALRCSESGISLKGQILIYPWIDGKLNNPSIRRNGKGYLLEYSTLLWFQQMYTPNKEDQCKPSVSPCYESDHANLAPAFILTAQFDPLLDDGLNYYKQLKEAGNRVQYKEYPGLIHGFFNLPGVDPAAKQSYDDIKEFMDGL